MKEFPCVEWTLMLSICDPSLFLDYTDSLYVCENWEANCSNETDDDDEDDEVWRCKCMKTSVERWAVEK